MGSLEWRVAWIGIHKSRRLLDLVLASHNVLHIRGARSWVNRLGYIRCYATWDSRLVGWLDASSSRRDFGDYWLVASLAAAGTRHCGACGERSRFCLGDLASLLSWQETCEAAILEAGAKAL